MKLIIDEQWELSDFQEGDQPALILYLQEKQIYDQTSAIPHPYLPEHAEEYVQQRLKAQCEGKNFSWALRRRADASLVGGMGFHEFDPEKFYKTEIGYWLAKPYWNQGIMSRALRALCQWGFENYPLQRMSATVFENNGASLQVLKKCGFVYEGLLKNYAQKDQKSKNCHLLARYRQSPSETSQQTNLSRPPFIRHYTELQQGDHSHYAGSDEKLSIGSPVGRALGLQRLGIHHEVLLPGRRSSWPHAESNEEEFAFVIEGFPEVWVDGKLYPLSPGDAVAFPVPTGICHTFINNTQQIVRLLVVGEASKSDNLIYYPLHPLRNQEVEKQNRLWKNWPQRSMGDHDGLPDLQRKAQKP